MFIMFLPLRRYADFDGRASRREFWSFFGLCAVVFIAVLILTGLSGQSAKPNRPGEAPPYWVVAYVVWWLATLIPWLAVQVRRFHDQGRTGWLVAVNIAGYLFFPAVPWVGLTLVAISMLLMALPGEFEADQHDDLLADHAHVNREEDAQSQITIADAPPEVETSAPEVEVETYSGPGIKLGQGGRFYLRGSSHNSLEDARSALAKSQGRHLTGRDDLGFEVSQTPDGRYSCGGYSFSTFDQALSYSLRRRTRSVTLPQRTVPPPSSASEIAPTRPVAPSINAIQPRQSADHSGVRTTPSAARWIASPTRVAVGDVVLDAELLYFGTRTREQRYSQHRALVDPDLPVAKYADKAGTTLNYWPNYAELQPQARRAYLEWLATGRRDPTTPVGYVFIFFYGLERRLIAEKSKADAPAILQELSELLAVYGNNHSFQRYCKALIEAAEVILELTPTTPQATPDLRFGWEIPISVRVHLGKKVRDGSPIDAEDALCWTLSHPQLSTRTAVTRCFDEFHALWRYRFRERFPDGIKVREPKARIQFNYRAASSEFYANATIDDLPDIGAISGPISKFDALLSSCGEELDPLSRFLGRNPDERRSVLAAALSPQPVRDRNSDSGFTKARAALVAAIEGGGFGQLTVGEVLDTLLQGSATVDVESRKTYLKRLSDILDAMRIGFEPDKRFGPPVPLADDTMLCLFEMRGETQPIESRAEYHSARTMVEVAVLAARADEVVVEAELQSIVTDLATVGGLNGVDQQRLHAHTLALVANPPKLRASTKRLLELPDSEKELVLTSVVNAIVADQRVTPAEVRFLEGLYKALGKPQDEVYTRLHAGGSAMAPQPGRSASGQPRRQMGAIDSDRLARIQQETSAVSTMLASIFREEEPEAIAAEVENSPTPKHAFAGLDAAHTCVLLGLTAQPLEADAFEALCRENRLLPGGAIETINDWAFDTLDDVAVEDDDVICIQPHLIEAIKQMSVAA